MGKLHGPALAAVVLLLVGCSAPLVPDATPTPAASTVTDGEPELGKVLATGSLVDAGGATVGDVEIRAAAHGTNELVISGYRPVPEVVSGRLSLEPLFFEECHDQGLAVATGGLSSDAVQTFVLGDFDDLPFESDFVSFGLMENTAPTAGQDCLLRVVAVAELTWPDSTAVVPTDWEPVDSGPAVGAMGTTTVDAEGVPLTYLVAAGDTPDAIRVRFDLYWSSLAREDGTAMPMYPTIYEGEVLTFVAPLPITPE
jgi:hypothetical protein